MIDKVGDFWAVDEHGNDRSAEPLLIAGEPFTKSNGTILSRIYERLTKASRRRQGEARPVSEPAYRRGVYDALKALQDELT